MRKKFYSRAVGVTLTAAMLASLTACGGDSKENPTNTPEPTKAETPSTGGDATTTPGADTNEPTAEPTPDPYEIKTDAAGNKIDLGGMEIVIRDWWTQPDEDGPNNAFEEAQLEWREWIQETYNFKISQQAISTWASTPEDFLNYVSTGGDENNYIFILRNGAEFASAMNSGLMYDLATLDCLDFSEAKWANGTHEFASKGDKIYAMSAETVEPKGGMYFNKRLLTEAGIDPESIYDLQEKGEWTWEKFEEICKQVQKDTDADGVIDRYAMVNFASTFFNEAVWSNNAEYIGKDANGKYVNKLESNETLQALNWAVDMLATYDYPQPEGSEWNYWAEAFVNGCGAFIAGETYQAGGDWSSMEDDFGFVCFPKGPNADDYTNMYNDNPFCIPSCYDADRAWKIAFAYNMWSEPVPGFEDYNGRTEAFYNNFRDTEAVDLTIARLNTNGKHTYHDMIPGLSLGPDLIWGMSKDNTPAQKAEAIRDTWAAYLEEANK